LPKEGVLFAHAAYGAIQGAVPAKATAARTIAVAMTTINELRNLSMTYLLW